MITVGLVGCGAIGTRLAHTVEQEFYGLARIVALYDVQVRLAHQLAQQLKRSHPAPCSLPQLIRRSQFIIEAASVSAVRRVVPAVLRAKKRVLVMSVGGLLEGSLWRRILRSREARVHVPSGALAGLDGIKAMAVGKIYRISLTTRKPPAGLVEAPYVKRKKLRLSKLRKPMLLLEGSARTVVRAFPQNANVAAALALAAGPAGRRLRVRILADPGIRRNIHEVDAEGEFGRLHCRIENVPSVRNQKTSEQAILSAIAVLRGIFSPVAIGT